jgi:hypothetical protein
MKALTQDDKAKAHTIVKYRLLVFTKISRLWGPKQPYDGQYRMDIPNRGSKLKTR